MQPVTLLRVGLLLRSSQGEGRQLHKVMINLADIRIWRHIQGKTLGVVYLWHQTDISQCYAITKTVLT